MQTTAADIATQKSQAEIVKSDLGITGSIGQ